MKARGKKHKGSRLERKFAELIRRYNIDKNAKRMVMSGAFAHFKGDILSSMPYQFECKNQERMTFWKWWDQAKEQERPLKKAILVHSANHRPIIVSMEAETFLNLYREMLDYRELAIKNKKC